MFRTKYRIVVDRFAGYEVQRKWWWMPFYIQVGINTHSTIDNAKKYLEQSKRTVVYEE